MLALPHDYVLGLHEAKKKFVRSNMSYGDGARNKVLALASPWWCQPPHDILHDTPHWDVVPSVVGRDAILAWTLKVHQRGIIKRQEIVWLAT